MPEKSGVGGEMDPGLGLAFAGMTMLVLRIGRAPD
jgi:hypothetical protein